MSFLYLLACQCIPGYSGDAKVQCDLLDFCESNPCGVGAECKNLRGSFKCSCKNSDEVGDPYTVGCQKAVECQINDDCPKSAKCVHENGIPKCRDVCEGVKCGIQAECRSENHAGSCVCREGYDGNPKDKINGCKQIPRPCQQNSDCLSDSYCNGLTCTPLCSQDLECQSHEACINNQCVNPCDFNGCGMNAECSTYNHLKCKFIYT